MIKWLADKTCISLTASVLPFAQLYGTGKTGTKDKVEGHRLHSRRPLPTGVHAHIVLCFVVASRSIQETKWS